jgi:hypothetical protein
VSEQTADRRAHDVQDVEARGRVVRHF